MEGVQELSGGCTRCRISRNKDWHPLAPDPAPVREERIIINEKRRYIVDARSHLDTSLARVSATPAARCRTVSFSLMKHARLPFGVDLQYPGEDVLRGAPMPSLSTGILLTGKRPRTGTRHQAKSAQAKEVAHRREAGHREREGNETRNTVVGCSSMYRRQSNIILLLSAPVSFAHLRPDAPDGAAWP